MEPVAGVHVSDSFFVGIVIKNEFVTCDVTEIFFTLIGEVVV